MRNTIIDEPKGVTKIWDVNQEENLKSRREKLEAEALEKQQKQQAALQAKKEQEEKALRSKHHEIVDEGIKKLDEEFEKEHPEEMVKAKTVSEDSAEKAFNSLPDNYKTVSGESIGKIKKGCAGVKGGKLIKRWHTVKTIKLICQRVDERGITLERIKGYIKL